MDSPTLFYEVAATLLPVLFLVLSFEQRVWTQRYKQGDPTFVPAPQAPSNPWVSLVVRFVLLAYLLAAESVAVRSTATGGGTDVAFAVVVGGIILSLALIGSLIIEEALTSRADQCRAGWQGGSDESSR